MRWVYLLKQYTQQQKGVRNRATMMRLKIYIKTKRERERVRDSTRWNKSRGWLSHFKCGSHMTLNNRKFLHKYHPNEPFCFNFSMRTKMAQNTHNFPIYYFAHWHYQYVNRMRQFMCMPTSPKGISSRYPNKTQTHRVWWFHETS